MENQLKGHTSPGLLLAYILKPMQRKLKNSLGCWVIVLTPPRSLTIVTLLIFMSWSLAWKAELDF